MADSFELSWLYVVPWKNRHEFVQTYLDLYSEVDERQRKAVNRITMWKCRVGHKLSAAVECSGQLTKALLAHRKAVSVGKHRKYSEELRLQLGCAVMRFVNYVTEKGQNSAYAQPVHEVAKEVKLSQFLVNVRHDVSHRQLPSTPILVRAAEESLKYLQKQFWSHQLDEKDYPKDRKAKRRKPLYNLAEMTILLQNYQKASYKSLNDGPESESAREANRALRQIDHALDMQQRNGILHVLVQTGQLQPEKSQLKLYNINVDETFKAWPHKVPALLVQMWRDVLRLVHKKQLTAILAQHLLVSMFTLDDENHLENFMLSAWLRLILLYETANYSGYAEERSSQPELYSSNIDFDRSLLLYTCKEKDKEKAFMVWTQPLLRLVNDGSVGEARLERIDRMFRLYRDRNYDFSDVRDSIRAIPKEGPRKNQLEEKLARNELFTIDDLKILKPELFQKEEKTEEEECLFKEVTDPVDWAMVPIGLNPQEAGYAGCLFEDPEDEITSQSASVAESTEEEVAGQEDQEMAEVEEKSATQEATQPEIDWH